MWCVFVPKLSYVCIYKQNYHQNNRIPLLTNTTSLSQHLSRENVYPLLPLLVDGFVFLNAQVQKQWLETLLNMFFIVDENSDSAALTNCIARRQSFERAFLEAPYSKNVIGAVVSLREGEYTCFACFGRTCVCACVLVVASYLLYHFVRQMFESALLAFWQARAIVRARVRVHVRVCTCVYACACACL